MREKNGEKPKIQITESVKIGIHSTVFSVGESLFPNPTFYAKIKHFLPYLALSQFI